MLSSQDEACELELRSEKISYHSVHGKVSFLGRLHKTFHKKSCLFFSGGKHFGHGNVACNFGHDNVIAAYL